MKRGVLFLGAALVAAGAWFLPRPGPSPRRAMMPRGSDLSAPAGSDSTPREEIAPARTAGATASPSAPSPAAASPERLRALLLEYPKLFAAGYDVEKLRAAEEEIQAELARQRPEAVVELYLNPSPPLVQQILLRAIDRGLARDRGNWEAALVGGLEKPLDPGRLEAAARATDERVQDPERRGEASRLLSRRASNDPLLALTGRLAAGSVSADEARAFLWARVPARGAVEGLGFVVRPEEALRLESLGPHEHVIRALETSYVRTKDPLFRSSLLRLGR